MELMIDVVKLIGLFVFCGVFFRLGYDAVRRSDTAAQPVKGNDDGSVRPPK